MGWRGVPRWWCDAGSVTISPDDYRMEQIANRAAEKAVERFAQLLGVSNDMSIDALRQNMSWATAQRARADEINDNIRWITEQRRQRGMMADTARKATIEKLMTGAGVVLTAMASGALIVFLAGKGIHTTLGSLMMFLALNGVFA